VNKRNKRMKKNEFVIPLLTNERTDVKATIMRSIYDATKFGRLAYVDCVDPDTKEVVPMLAMIGDMEGSEFDISKVFPIAYFIASEEESLRYGIANGNGQYITRERDLGVFDGLGKQIDANLVEEWQEDGAVGSADTNMQDMPSN